MLAFGSVSCGVIQVYFQVSVCVKRGSRERSAIAVRSATGTFPCAHAVSVALLEAITSTPVESVSAR